MFVASSSCVVVCRFRTYAPAGVCVCVCGRLCSSRVLSVSLFNVRDRLHHAVRVCVCVCAYREREREKSTLETLANEKKKKKNIVGSNTADKQYAQCILTTIKWGTLAIAPCSKCFVHIQTYICTARAFSLHSTHIDRRLPTQPITIATPHEWNIYYRKWRPKHRRRKNFMDSSYDGRIVCDDRISNVIE